MKIIKFISLWICKFLSCGFIVSALFTIAESEFFDKSRVASFGTLLGAIVIVYVICDYLDKLFGGGEKWN